MKVIVDTSVWSLALRRNDKADDSPHTTLFRELITDGRVVLLGSVRQEILSGIRHAHQYNQLKNYLRAFSHFELDIGDYELASEFYNTCRSNGVQGASTDFIICAVAVHRNHSILTTDKDFDNFSQYIPITLLQC
ncbi:PIN domain-containing protein [Calothrix sp. PCC 7507]|uniref:type II toxin-antitoxin system VapC family toxin n=1 Tax=Calothrix sp. PCC 7507 TaxID=99598 RepID=UPI00029F4A12|nr:PIN domain-containing protein [Calothrix sp. PCC 7507]AFY31962.1 PilT protein domain protein [Calothrix sp. PCC 7507]